jgi:hypothetical protein
MEKEIKEEKVEAQALVAPKYNTTVFVLALTTSVLLAGALIAICSTVILRDHHDSWRSRPGLVVIDQQFGPRMMTRRLF